MDELHGSVQDDVAEVTTVTADDGAIGVERREVPERGRDELGQRSGGLRLFAQRPILGWGDGCVGMALLRCRRR